VVKVGDIPGSSHSHFDLGTPGIPTRIAQSLRPGFVPCSSAQTLVVSRATTAMAAPIS
jgi:hypothetical protein